MDQDNGSGRLDRIERIVEVLANSQAQIEQEFRRLLTAQVLLTDAQRQTEEKLNALADAQRQTEEKLNALIGVVDGWIREQRSGRP